MLRTALCLALATVCAPNVAQASINVSEAEPNDGYASAQLLPFQLYNPTTVTGAIEGTSAGMYDFYAFDPPSEQDAYQVDLTVSLESDLDGLGLWVFFPKSPGFAFYPPTQLVQQIGNLSRERFTLAVGRTTAGATGSYRLILSAVPEPATWALMLAGFGMVGFAMRRRRVAFA